MDSIHCSPVVTTPAQESPDYESSVESYSFCEEREDEDLTMDSNATCDECTDICVNYSNHFNNITTSYMTTIYANNNLNISNENNAINELDETLSDIILSPKKCQILSHSLNNTYLDIDKKGVNVKDIESQIKLPLNRKKSLICRLYSNNSAFNRHKKPAIRLSILGRPIPWSRSRNDTAFYKEKFDVYNFLNRPQGRTAISYHIFVSFIVFVCLVLTVFSTVSVYESSATNALKYMDSLVAILFSAEFMARLWSASCISHYQGWRGTLRFLRNPFRIIDILVIITSCIVLLIDTKRQTMFVYFRGFRFFQVFQMLRLEHRFRPWPVMSSVVWQQREHLAITTYMGFLALLFVSFVIYFVEKDVNPQFNSIAASMWWAVVTLCTVGYGDMTPITPVGKFLASISIVIGVSIFALPAGILGTGLALKVQEQQRVRQMGKRREPAAKLIQCTWRCYVSSENSMSKVTWKPHLRIHDKPLTFQERSAIRFIRVVKYFIARKKFNTALKPYDIKDVLEQYASGHADVLGRVKHMQSRLTSVQASVNNNLRSLNESKVILTSRIIQLETIASDLHKTLSQLMDIQIKEFDIYYKQQKKLVLTYFLNFFIIIIFYIIY
ncbi:potassium voltage-gated channel subfamily KQT member 5-like [Oppia nitens]|uniref:potassium voltage-gated channel subfamily KQT member 5-like n=1 Tax=Oppia nitens TaxID=1686743 RepID=UPI0023DAB8EA|nr:potassium voltage-gated channel subfamily KQT member 5-like [Oppia nitens]XP_054153138.1 potassium voltage-gated channel subfamily KQT member 5-like [Oppia nitens]